MNYSQIPDGLQILTIGLFLIGVAVLILFIATCCAIIHIDKNLARFIEFQIDKQNKENAPSDKTRS